METHDRFVFRRYHPGLLHRGLLFYEDGALGAIATCITPGSSLLVAIEREGQLDFAVEGWFFDGTQLHRAAALISFPLPLVEAMAR